MTERKMRRIEGLLSKAAHPNTPENERISAQEKADALMVELQIDRAHFNFNRKKDEVRQPVEREYDRVRLIPEGAVGNSRRDSEEWGIEVVINSVRESIIQHSGARCVNQLQTLAVVGYEEDILYGEMLWLSTFKTILERMFPTWSKERSFDENVYVLKKAGYSWGQVGSMGVANEAFDSRGKLTMKNGGSKLRNAYKRHAASLGEEVLPGRQQPMNPHLWRRSFVDSFSKTISQRMAALKSGREEYFDKTNLPAIIQDKDRVDQMFYEKYPFMDPKNATPTDPPKGRSKKMRVRVADPSAWNEGNRAANSVKLSRDEQFEKPRSQIS